MVLKRLGGRGGHAEIPCLVLMSNGASNRIAILSSGVWELRDAIREITGFEPVRWLPPLSQPEFGCVVGWGLKPTTRRARRLSQKNDADFIALEDGFIRSVCPGPNEPPLSLVADRTGVYYDATDVSDLEKLIVHSATDFDPARLERAGAGMSRLRRLRLSKYNHAPLKTERELGLDPARRAGRVVIVDQTAGDSSITYGAASARSFKHMVDAARRENPGMEIAVKLHPEVVAGRKNGHLANLNDPDVVLIKDDANPWSLIEVVDKVYVVTSQFGLDALIGGREVHCFGMPFFAGWGLTHDRLTTTRRVARPTIEQLFAAVYFDYSRYISPETGREISFETAVDWIEAARTRYFAKSARRRSLKLSRTTGWSTRRSHQF